MQGELRVFGKMKGDSAIAPCQINGVHIIRQEGHPFAAARTLEMHLLAGGGDEDRETAAEGAADAGGEIQPQAVILHAPHAGKDPCQLCIVFKAVVELGNPGITS